MLMEKMPNSVLVVSPSSRIYELLNEILPTDSFMPIEAVSGCGDAKRTLLSKEYSIVVVNAPLRDEFGSEFALELVQNSTSAVLLLADSGIFEQVASSVEGLGVMTLQKPLSRATLYSAMKLAAATHARLLAMDSKNKSLSAKMVDIRTINRAKWALIKQLGMAEEQAHRYIEKQAMDMRLSKGQVAESIIRTYEN